MLKHTRCERMSNSTADWEPITIAQARCGAGCYPSPHRTGLPWLSRISSPERISSVKDELRTPALSSGERGPDKVQLTTVNFATPTGLVARPQHVTPWSRQATGPQRPKGGSSPNPRSCQRLTQVFSLLQAGKASPASLSCAFPLRSTTAGRGVQVHGCARVAATLRLWRRPPTRRRP